MIARAERSHPELRVDNPDSAEALCACLMKTAGELIDLLDQETAVLRRGGMTELAGLQMRKAALNATLMRDVARFRGDLVYLRAAVPGRLAELKSRFQSFERTLETNQAALAAMRSISDSLLKAIAAKSASAQAGPEVYGKNAAAACAQPRRPTAISIDRSL